MNIVLFLNRDLQSNLAYHLLKPHFVEHQVTIYLSESVGGNRKKPEELDLLESFERKHFYEELPGLIKKNGIQCEFEFFNEEFYSAPISVCYDVNAPSFLNEISDLNPDLFISIRFAKIFHDNIIAIPRKGVLNLHSGILPDYRGILGTLHALREGRDQVGCTLHYIGNSMIDTGDIIDIAYLPTTNGRSLFWHIVNLYPLGCELITRSLITLNKLDRLPTHEQYLSEGSYFSLPTSEHFNQLQSRGFEIFSLADYKDFLDRWVAPSISHLMYW
ncbi:MAG: formyl transferase [Saprospiraceae bacterium]|nr:formyl transferase [Saprospiraceae bacterium]